ncbi:MAG: hypothetical protein ACR2NG_05900 [Acidimicrobiia bacterium]
MVSSSIAAQRVVADGSHITFEVHDNGPGIPRRHEVRIWDRFDRGPNRLNAAVPGSGIASQSCEPLPRHMVG